MEKENKVPPDEKRRRIITTILNIPPAYFGLAALTPLFPRMEHMKIVPSSSQKNVDLVEYDEELHRFWRSYYSRSNAAIESIFIRIRALEDTLIYGQSYQKDPIAKMLCEYLTLFGNIRRDQGYSSALMYLSKAALLAEERGYYELQAKALYLRGYCLLDRWKTLPTKDNRMDLVNAINDFNIAYTLAEKYGLTKPLKAAVFAEWGVALAYNALEDKDKRSALAMIDKVGQIVTSSDFKQDQRFLNINNDWYHIDKVGIFLALNQPKAALKELAQVTKGNPRTQRRYLTMEVAEAKAFAHNIQVEMSVAYAESALEVADDIQSCRHITSINTLYEELRANEKYKAHPDVARLGIKLLKVYQPALFVD